MLEGTGLIFEQTSGETIAIRRDQRQVKVDTQDKTDVKPARTDSHKLDLMEKNRSDIKLAQTKHVQEERDEVILEEVVVTAEKREADIQKTPLGGKSGASPCL